MGRPHADHHPQPTWPCAHCPHHRCPREPSSRHEHPTRAPCLQSGRLTSSMQGSECGPALANTLHRPGHRHPTRATLSLHNDVQPPWTEHTQKDGSLAGPASLLGPHPASQRNEAIPATAGQACTPLQYSCLENPKDGGAWWAAVHGVAKSQTRLSDFTFPFHFHALEKEMATHSSTLAWKIPWRSLVGYSPWGCKESDTTEQLHLS